MKDGIYAKIPITSKGENNSKNLPTINTLVTVLRNFVALAEGNLETSKDKGKTIYWWTKIPQSDYLILWIQVVCLKALGTGDPAINLNDEFSCKLKGMMVQVCCLMGKFWSGN